MKLLATLRGAFAFAVIILNTIVACVPLYLMAALRWISPASARARWNRRMDGIIDYWTGCNRALIARLGICDIQLDAAPDLQLSRDAWYLLTCNHQSWSDILLLQNSLRPVLPPVKFFTKRELIWLPALGPAMWMLGFPYVRRPSREAIAANPALRDADREEIRRACAGFRSNPVAVLNFTEGTRFTRAKRAAQGSPYQHLLKPRIGGVELVLNGLADELDGLLDVTIHYPGAAPSFWRFLCGDCPSARLSLRHEPLPAAVCAGLRAGNRAELAAWLEDIWQRKDRALATAALATAQGVHQHSDH